jgi:hypothetical protein
VTGSPGAQPDQHPKGGCSGARAVLSTLSECFEIEVSDFEIENTTLKHDYSKEVVQTIIGGVVTDYEIRFMFLFMSLSRRLLQGSI